MSTVDDDSAWNAISLAHSPADYLAIARDPTLEEPAQMVLVGKNYSFVSEALAANPGTSATVLAEILARPFVSEWSWNRTLELIARHPAASRDVLLLVRDRILEVFRSGGRPYAAGRALAERPEFSPDDVRPLLDAPGGSSRFRRSVKEALAQRLA